MEISKEVLDKATESLSGGKKAKRPKHGMRSTHVDHLQDGTHVARMQPYDGEEITYSAADHKELADKIKKYLGGEAAEPAAEEANESPAEEAAEKV